MICGKRLKKRLKGINVMSKLIREDNPCTRQDCDWQDKHRHTYYEDGVEGIDPISENTITCTKCGEEVKPQVINNEIVNGTYWICNKCRIIYNPDFLIDKKPPHQENEMPLRCEKQSLLIGTIIGQLAQLLNYLKSDNVNMQFVYDCLLDITTGASLQINEMYYKSNKP